jgi:uncharacterized protein (DUF983 family)
MPAGPRRPLRVLARAAKLRCPRCGTTPLFRGWFTMHETCDRCGLRFERAQGYFVGAIYVNYGVTASLVLAGYLLLWRYANLTLATQFAIWLPVTLLFPLWFFRYSRSFWLALEYLINPEGH